MRLDWLRNEQAMDERLENLTRRRVSERGPNQSNGKESRSSEKQEYLTKRSKRIEKEQIAWKELEN